MRLPADAKYWIMLAALQVAAEKRAKALDPSAVNPTTDRRAKKRSIRKRVDRRQKKGRRG